MIIQDISNLELAQECMSIIVRLNLSKLFQEGESDKLIELTRRISENNSVFDAKDVKFKDKQKLICEIYNDNKNI